MGQKNFKEAEQKIKRLLDSFDSEITAGNKLDISFTARFKELKTLVNSIDNSSLQKEYWLAQAQASRFLAEPESFAEAIFALEDLVSDEESIFTFDIHYNAAIYYVTYSDSSLALSHILAAHEIAQKLSNKNLLFKSTTLMGVVYDRLGNGSMATKLATEALKTADQPVDLLIASVNLADRYRINKEFAKAEALLDDAEELLSKVEDTVIKQSKILLDEKRAWLYKDLGRTIEAIISFSAAIAGSKAADNFSEGYFSSVAGLTEIYFSQGKYMDGISLCEVVLDAQNAGDDVYLKAYFNMAEGYRNIGDFEKAFDYLEKAHNLEKKIQTERSDSKLRAWEARYNFNVERRDKEIAIQQRIISELQNKDLRNEVISGQMEMMRRLAIAAEKRDDETSEHTQRVAKLSKHIALLMGLDKSFAEKLGFAALFHDIGKIGIPDVILLKPEPLTPTEFEVMKKHTTMGAEILTKSRLDIMQIAERIAMSHHERWDGHGYPNGLEGDNIPLEGRIVAVADAFDAMTSNRPYRRAIELKNSVEELMKGAGGQFDAIIVDRFLNWLEQTGVNTAEAVVRLIDDIKDLDSILEYAMMAKYEEEVIYVSPERLTNGQSQLMIANE